MYKHFTLFTLLIAVCSLAVWAGVNPQKEKGKAKADAGKVKESRDKESAKSKAQVKTLPEGGVIQGKKAPEGAVIRGAKITLKAGYRFEKQSANTVAVARDNGDITGKFSCSCAMGSPGGGSCELTIGNDSAWCHSGSCNNCSLVVTINPKGAFIDKGQIQTAPLKKAKK